MTCPFCKGDPYHYENNGIGDVPVAVVCCELGIAFHQDSEEDVTLTREEFKDIGGELGILAYLLERVWEGLPCEEDIVALASGGPNEVDIEKFAEAVKSIFLILCGDENYFTKTGDNSDE